MAARGVLSVWVPVLSLACAGGTVPIAGDRPDCVTVTWTGDFRGASLGVRNDCTSMMRCSTRSIAPGARPTPLNTTDLASDATEESSWIGTSPATIVVDCAPPSASTR